MRTGRGINKPFNEATSGSNRSDSVRQRRTQRTQQRASSAADRIAHPAAPARPVIMRGVLNNSQPIYRQAARTNPRRQFYVAMDNARATGVAGAELRLPAIPLTLPGWRAISLLLVLVLAFGLFSIWNSPFFRVSTISIEGLQRLSATDLETVVHLQNLSIVEINPAQVKEAIATAFPELADVVVSVELPNYVTVTARERQPLMAWKNGDTTDWIDSEGYIFPARGEAGPLVTIQSDDNIPLAAEKSEPPAGQEDQSAGEETQKTALPRLNGLSALAPAYQNRRADMKVLNASLQLVKKLPEGTLLAYDKQNGLGWTDPGGWQVYIGKDLENFEAKLKTYQTIVQDLQNQGIHPELVSVEHLNAPFYRANEQAAADSTGQDN